MSSKPDVRNALSAGDQHGATLLKLIWIYFWLLIIEGALRKWILPSWSAALLVIRDPVMVTMIVIAVRRGLFKWGIGMCLFLIGTLAFYLVGSLQIIADGVRWTVVMYGIRTYLLHLPLPFIMLRVMSPDDIKSMLRWCCIVSIVMLPLIVIQFESPPGAWVNRVASGEGWGEERGQISAGMNRVRPTGTFSYNLGVTFFYAIVFAAGIANEWVNLGIRRLVTRIAFIATALMTTVSGSRTTVTTLGLILIASIPIPLVLRQRLGQGLAAAGVLIGLLLGLVTLSSASQSGVEVLLARFADAASVEASNPTTTISNMAYLQRVVESFSEAHNALQAAPLLGRGLGLGTNVGSQLTVGSTEFLLAENDWTRIIYEAGPLLGGAYVCMRIWLTVWLLLRAVRSLISGGALALLLWSACAYAFAMGSWGPPMNQGFAVFTAGLCLAGTKLAVERELVARYARERVRGVGNTQSRAKHA
jgi:hypothetical protein